MGSGVRGRSFPSLAFSTPRTREVRLQDTSTLAPPCSPPGYPYTMPKNRIVETLEAVRALRRRRKLQKQQEQEKKMPSPKRTQSMPIIRIVSTRANDEECLGTTGETEQVNLQPRVQMESEEEDELLRLRMQLQAESESRKHYSTISVQHNYNIEYVNSRVSAQQSQIGFPTVPDTATHFENERVLRRFPTAPQRPKTAMQPLQLHIDDEDVKPFVKNETNGTPEASKSQSLFCGIPVSCDPSPPKNNDSSSQTTPGIEMQDSFRTLFEPINDKARKFFGGASVRSSEHDDGASSAVTEPFNNRSMQRNGTWASAFSFGAWNLPKDKSDDNPTSVTQVPGLPASPLPSQDEEWDTSQIADRMEQSLILTTVSEQDRYEDGVSSEDAYYGDGEILPIRVALAQSESSPSQHRPTIVNDLCTKFAATEQPVVVKTKNLRTTSPEPGDSFWEDLLAEGIIEREDFSACSSGFGIEIVNAED